MSMKDEIIKEFNEAFNSLASGYGSKEPLEDEAALENYAQGAEEMLEKVTQILNEKAFSIALTAYINEQRNDIANAVYNACQGDYDNNRANDIIDAVDYALINIERELGMEQNISRKQVIQYCLDQGTGIEYMLERGELKVEDYNKDGKMVVAETTEAELESAGDKARYVNKETVDWFYEAVMVDKVAYEAVKTNMDLLDFDEWRAINSALGVEFSRQDSFAINGILWENYDVSPMDIESLETSKAATVREALFPDLTPQDEKKIFDILQKYDCPLAMSELTKKSLAQGSKEQPKKHDDVER